MKKSGRFIVIEGTDGAGKATQTMLLQDYLQSIGRDVETIAFPRYDQTSSWLVKEYLAGWFGSAGEVPAKAASAFFAFDRLQAADQIRDWLKAGKVVIADRWVSANKGHQLGKIYRNQAKQDYLDWLNQFEYEHNGLPVPDLTVLLYLDPVLAQADSSAKGGVKNDVHESDPKHLKRAATAYLWAARHDTVERWQIVSVAPRKQRLTREQVQQKIRQLILPKL